LLCGQALGRLASGKSYARIPSRASKNRDSQERRVRPLIVRCCRVRKIQMSTYYTGRRAQRYNERWRTFSGKTLAEALAMIDVTALRNVPEHLGRPPRVLDVACGTGILLKELLERVPGIEVYGADASADMLVQARAPGSGGLDSTSHAPFLARGSLSLPQREWDSGNRTPLRRLAIGSYGTQCGQRDKVPGLIQLAWRWTGRCWHIFRLPGALSGVLVPSAARRRSAACREPHAGRVAGQRSRSESTVAALNSRGHARPAMDPTALLTDVGNVIFF